MAIKTRALSIGYVARHKLSLLKQENGIIHSVFNKVINIYFNNAGLLSIGKTEVPMNLLHIRLHIPYINFSNLFFNLNEKVQAGENKIIIGNNFIIDLTGSELYNSLFDKSNNVKIAGSSTILTIIKNIISTALSYQFGQEGFFTLIPHILEFGNANIKEAELPLIAAKAYYYINELAYATYKKDYLAGIKAAINLIGLGPGLTPSGDDFLSGFMVAQVNYYRLQSKKSTFAQIVFPLIAAHSITYTNPISCQQIIWAANGYSHEILEKLCMDILTANYNEAQISLCKLLNIGSTSGIDQLTGLLVGITIGIKQNLQMT